MPAKATSMLSLPTLASPPCPCPTPSVPGLLFLQRKRPAPRPVLRALPCCWDLPQGALWGKEILGVSQAEIHLPLCSLG